MVLDLFYLWLDCLVPKRKRKSVVNETISKTSEKLSLADLWSNLLVRAWFLISTDRSTELSPSKCHLSAPVTLPREEGLSLCPSWLGHPKVNWLQFLPNHKQQAQPRTRVQLLWHQDGFFNILNTDPSCQMSVFASSFKFLWWKLLQGHIHVLLYLNYYPQMDIVKSLQDWRADADGVMEAWAITDRLLFLSVCGMDQH